MPQRILETPRRNTIPKTLTPKSRSRTQQLLLKVPPTPVQHRRRSLPQVTQTPSVINLLSTNANSTPELHKTACVTSSEKTPGSGRQIRQLPHIASEMSHTCTSSLDISKTASSEISSENVTTSPESAPGFISPIRYLPHAPENTPTVDNMMLENKSDLIDIIIDSDETAVKDNQVIQERSNKSYCRESKAV